MDKKMPPFGGILSTVQELSQLVPFDEEFFYYTLFFLLIRGFDCNFTSTREYISNHVGLVRVQNYCCLDSDFHDHLPKL